MTHPEKPEMPDDNEKQADKKAASMGKTHAHLVSKTGAIAENANVGSGGHIIDDTRPEPQASPDVEALKREVFENMGDTDKPFFTKAGETIHLAPEQLVYKAIDYLISRGLLQRTPPPEIADRDAKNCIEFLESLRPKEPNELETVCMQWYQAQATINALSQRTPQSLEAIKELLNNYDAEAHVIHVSPDPGCLECTAWTTPNNKNTGLCAFHKATNLVKENCT